MAANNLLRQNDNSFNSSELPSQLRETSEAYFLHQVLFTPFVLLIMGETYA